MIHAILRLALLGLNILDTFKTLKLRIRKGQHEPSARAVAQRKRDMKGVLCVWVVCMSVVICESIGDRTVGYVTPFYNQIKTMIFLFLIFTRASGAELIVLHVIRPFIKPYTKIIDSSLEFLFILSCFVVELARIPWKKLMVRWDAFVATKENLEDNQEDSEILPEESGDVDPLPAESNPSLTRSSSLTDGPVQSVPVAFTGGRTAQASHRLENKPLPAAPARTRSTRSTASTSSSSRSIVPPASRPQHSRLASSSTIVGRPNVSLSNEQRAAAELAVRQGRGIMRDMADAQGQVREAMETGRELRNRNRERGVNGSNRHEDHSQKDEDGPGDESNGTVLRQGRAAQSDSSRAGTVRRAHGIASTSRPAARLPVARQQQPSDSGSQRGPFITYVPAPPAEELAASDYEPPSGSSRSGQSPRDTVSAWSSSHDQSEYSSHSSSQPLPSSASYEYYAPSPPPPAPPPNTALDAVNPFLTPSVQYPLPSPPSYAAGSLYPNDALASAQTSSFAAASMTMPVPASSHTSVSAARSQLDISQFDIDGYFDKAHQRDSGGTDKWEGLTQLSLLNKSPAVPQPQSLYPLLQPLISSSAPSTNHGRTASTDRATNGPASFTRSSAGSNGRPSPRKHAHKSPLSSELRQDEIVPESPSQFTPATPPSEYLHDMPLPEDEYPSSVARSALELPGDGQYSLSHPLREPISPGPLYPGGFNWSFSQAEPNLDAGSQSPPPDSRPTTVQDFDELRKQYEAGMFDSPVPGQTHIPGHFPSTPVRRAVFPSAEELEALETELSAPSPRRSPRKRKSKTAVQAGHDSPASNPNVVDIASTLGGDRARTDGGGDDEEWRNSMRVSIFDPPAVDPLKAKAGPPAQDVNDPAPDEESEDEGTPVENDNYGTRHGRSLSAVIDNVFASAHLKSASRREEESMPPLPSTADRTKYQPTAISAAAMTTGGPPPTQSVLRPPGSRLRPGAGAMLSKRDAIIDTQSDPALSAAESASPSWTETGSGTGTGTRSVRSRPPPIMTERPVPRAGRPGVAFGGRAPPAPESTSSLRDRGSNKDVAVPQPKPKKASSSSISGDTDSVGRGTRKRSHLSGAADAEDEWEDTDTDIPSHTKRKKFVTKQPAASGSSMPPPAPGSIGERSSSRLASRKPSGSLREAAAVAANPVTKHRAKDSEGGDSLHRVTTTTTQRHIERTLVREIVPDEMGVNVGAEKTRSKRSRK